MLAALIVSLFFLFIGYSSLLHFYIQEKEIIPAKDLFFPKPKKGKTMPVIALILSLLFLVVAIAIAITPTTPSRPPANQSTAVIALIITPILIYSFYTYSGIVKVEDRLYFREPKKHQKS